MWLCGSLLTAFVWDEAEKGTLVGGVGAALSASSTTLGFK